MSIDPQTIGQPELANVCSQGWRPLLLTIHLLDYLRNHFAAKSNIVDPALANTLWSATPSNSHILIESISRWVPQLTEERPGIIIKRGDIHNLRLAINDHFLGGFTDGKTLGSDAYSTIFTGSHTIFCLDREGSAVEILTAEVYQDLLEFSPVIRSSLGFYKYTIQQIGGIFKVEESRSTFAVPITVSYAFGENWLITKNSALLKTLDLTLSTNQP